MYGKLIVGYRETAQGRDALELGNVLARAFGAEMQIATVDGDPGGSLAALARSEGADLIVLGSSHRGPLGRIVPGATAYRVLAEGGCAIAVAPAGFAERSAEESGWHPLAANEDEIGLHVIGVAYDGSAAARHALDVAAELAIANGAALRVYTVAVTRPEVAVAASPQAIGSAEPARLRDSLLEAVAKLPPEARALPVYLRGFPAAEILGAVECGVDLLLMGSRGDGPLRRGLLGSVSTTVLERAGCPVIVSPSRVGAPLEAVAH
jgi:nucleotide-binding universal stress UspA family protein